VRARRDAAAAETALAGVRRVASGEGNLLPPLREALRARCTIGELCGALREQWGMHDAAPRG
jgi:methylmalonyl-CoA mutase N-terminal domain/subunit